SPTMWAPTGGSRSVVGADIVGERGLPAAGDMWKAFAHDVGPYGRFPKRCRGRHWRRTGLRQPLAICERHSPTMWAPTGGSRSVVGADIVGERGFASRWRYVKGIRPRCGLLRAVPEALQEPTLSANVASPAAGDM